MVNIILFIVLNLKLFHSVRTKLVEFLNSKIAFQKVLYQTIDHPIYLKYSVWNKLLTINFKKVETILVEHVIWDIFKLIPCIPLSTSEQYCWDSMITFKHLEQGKGVQENIYLCLLAMQCNFSQGDINFMEFHNICETDCNCHVAQEKNLIGLIARKRACFIIHFVIIGMVILSFFFFVIFTIWNFSVRKDTAK